MTGAPLLPRVRIAPIEKDLLPLGMGGSFYGLDYREGEAGIRRTLEAALEHGLHHFDTATDYGDGASERLLGRFITAEPGRRHQIFLASKASLNEVSARAISRAIDASRSRLQTDVIDLYYLHWPRTGQDLRPWMEGLEAARQQGRIRAVGVSNFSVAQMEQLAEVGHIDVCQVGYNLLWRFPERDLLPYCARQRISVVAYSALAHGILAGQYPRYLTFAPGDQRWSISLFQKEVWPRIHETVRAFEQVAEHSHLPLATLALRWLLHQPAVTCVLVSAKIPQQVLENVQALNAAVPEGSLDQLKALSDRSGWTVPDERTPFGYSP